MIGVTRPVGNAVAVEILRGVGWIADDIVVGQHHAYAIPPMVSRTRFDTGRTSTDAQSPRRAVIAAARVPILTIAFGRRLFTAVRRIPVTIDGIFLAPLTSPIHTCHVVGTRRITRTAMVGIRLQVVTYRSAHRFVRAIDACARHTDGRFGTRMVARTTMGNIGLDIDTRHAAQALRCRTRGQFDITQGIAFRTDTAALDTNLFFGTCVATCAAMRRILLHVDTDVIADTLKFVVARVDTHAFDAPFVALTRDITRTAMIVIMRDVETYVIAHALRLLVTRVDTHAFGAPLVALTCDVARTAMRRIAHQIGTHMRAHRLSRIRTGRRTCTIETCRPVVDTHIVT